jgi:hypothetical protein
VATISVHPTGWHLDGTAVTARAQHVTASHSVIRLELGADVVIIHCDREDVHGVAAAIAADLIAALPVIGDPDVAA